MTDMPADQPGHRACPVDTANAYFARNPHAPVHVQPHLFHALHMDGGMLIVNWKRRADKARTTDAFEAFIYAWISFNGWARRGRG